MCVCIYIPYFSLWSFTFIKTLVTSSWIHGRYMGEKWKQWQILFSSVQLLSRVRLFATPWTAARQASLSITNSWSLLKLTSIELVMPSNHLILCCPFSSIFLGSTIGADSDGSHEIKRCLPLQRKAMTNLDSLLKSRDISLHTMVCKVKAMVFLVFVYVCES